MINSHQHPLIPLADRTKPRRCSAGIPSDGERHLCQGIAHGFAGRERHLKGEDITGSSKVRRRKTCRSSGTRRCPRANAVPGAPGSQRRPRSLGSCYWRLQSFLKSLLVASLLITVPLREGRLRPRIPVLALLFLDCPVRIGDHLPGTLA